VAAQIETLRRRRNVSLKEIVNDVLRRGLRDTREPTKRRKPFRTPTFDVGKVLIPYRQYRRGALFDRGRRSQVILSTSTFFYTRHFPLFPSASVRMLG